ncbi:AraC family transcriptional regulator [Winogradskyella arenosi]|uniref:Tetratricopeptide repeat protein n=1 Tax=Winogradskyella arenosi TaxID=533325 RepID=A0A368ZLM3_9FLAO|nr:AraC family transcriptional regulator [Winogradskyella arenosi]RCW93476.1 tetratricopeptide repeat protein [Winogradskyella arenosi]
MKKVIFVFVCSLFILCLNGQERDTLSLKSYDNLSSLIDKSYLENPELSETLIAYYIEKAERESNAKETIRGLSKFINLQINLRHFDAFKAEQEQMFALATTDVLEQELTAITYKLGRSYFFQGRIGKAMEMQTHALALAKKQNQLDLESAVLMQLGFVKSFVGDREASITYLKQALDISQRQDLVRTPSATESNLRQQVVTLYYLSQAYIKSKVKDSAKAYVNQAITFNRIVKDSCLTKRLYRTQGEVNLLYGKYNEALSNFETSKTYCLPISELESLVYSGLYGKAYIGLKAYAKAQKILQEGLDNYHVSEEEEGFMEDHYKMLAKAYKYNGNIEKSNFYFEKYILTTEALNKIQDTVVGVFKQQELKAFEAELDAINSEKNSFKYSVAVSVVIILILLIFLFRFSRLKKKNEAKFKMLLEKVNAENHVASVSDHVKDEVPEDNPSDINETTKNQILEGLRKLEAQEYFLRQDCNSYNVAKKIKTNTSYLSKVINSHYQKNFNTYINDLRINYAVLKLKTDTRFRKFSIQSIAEEVGYKSADSFTKYFKKKTGLNPSFYIKKLNTLD